MSFIHSYELQKSKIGKSCFFSLLHTVFRPLSRGGHIESPENKRPGNVLFCNGNWTEWSTIQGVIGEQFQIGRARCARTIRNYEDDYP